MLSTDDINIAVSRDDNVCIAKLAEKAECFDGCLYLKRY